jgi:hypothetical protein
VKLILRSPAFFWIGHISSSIHSLRSMQRLGCIVNFGVLQPGKNTLN